MKRALYAFGVLGLSLLWGVPSEAGVNLALSGTASQSSILSSGFAGRCNDGNTDGHFLAGSVCHTAEDQSPWWQVQLDDDYLIDNIVIWNRTDCCSTRTDNFTVAIFDGADQVWSENHGYSEFTFIDINMRHMNLDIDVPESVSGDRVRITINATDFLNLAEVEVFLDETPTVVPEPGTLALAGLGLACLGFARRRRTDRVS